MEDGILFHKVRSNENNFIELIAEWYLNEWDIPIEQTSKRLANIPNDDVIFQLLLLKNNEPVATGGLYNKINLLKVHPKFLKFKPWVALLYTPPKNRNRGFAEKLLFKIEDIANELGFKELYLHSFTAERLYLKNKWIAFDRVEYKEHITAVMKKEI